MARPRQDVTDAELAILELLWDRVTASTRQIVDALYPGGGASRYATVQKQLERMETKGLIHRDRSYFQHLFTAAIDREELEDARWFTRDEVALMFVGKHPEGISIPPPIAIAHHIIRAWVEQGDGVFK